MSTWYCLDHYIVRDEYEYSYRRFVMCLVLPIFECIKIKAHFLLFLPYNSFLFINNLINYMLAFIHASVYIFLCTYLGVCQLLVI